MDIYCNSNLYLYFISTCLKSTMLKGSQTFYHTTFYFKTFEFYRRLRVWHRVMVMLSDSTGFAVGIAVGIALWGTKALDKSSQLIMLTGLKSMSSVEAVTRSPQLLFNWIKYVQTLDKT